jgi:hypothetical protein
VSVKVMRIGWPWALQALAHYDPKDEAGMGETGVGEGGGCALSEMPVKRHCV